jgi:hypothetical protein
MTVMADKTAAELRSQAEQVKAQAAAAAGRAEDLLKLARKLEREERQAAARAEAQMWNDKAWNEIGQHFFSREVHEVVYGQAYADAPAYGYSEVHSTYENLAEMVRKVLEIGK